MWPLAPTTRFVRRASHARQCSGPGFTVEGMSTSLLDCDFWPTFSRCSRSPLFHTSTLPSIEHEKSTLCEVAKARPVTQPLCSARVRTWSPVSESHVLIVVSADPVEISRRSGL